MSNFDELTVTSDDKIKWVEDTKVPPLEEKRPIDSLTIKSYTSSMKPKSDRNN